MVNKSFGRHFESGNL